MNFAKSLHRKNVELDRFPSQTNCGPRNRNSRDPFEGDPFKVQSLNFRYAEKPIFYPISNRGKSLIEKDKSLVRHIFYNHDHTIPKCDKENLPLGYSKQSQLSQESINVRKSTSARSLSVAAKVYNAEKSMSSISPASYKLKTVSQDLALNGKKTSFLKGLEPSKSFIGQPTCSMSSSSPNSNLLLRKRPSKLKNTLQKTCLSESMTDINVDNGCLITIKINGVPRNQVHIKNNDNIEISLPKIKKVKSTKPLINSPHALKPSRSYVIHKSGSASNVAQVNVPQNGFLSKNLKECSDHSMVPHKEEKNGPQEANANASSTESLKICSNLRLKRNLERHASTLERIFSNNPIVVPPKERLLFSRSKTTLGKRCSSSATINVKAFDKSF